MSNVIKQPRASNLSKSLPLISTIMLVGLLALVMFSVFSLLERDQKDRVLPKAQQGVINLRTINFDTDNSVPLTGEWSFYWDKMLSHEQIAQEQNSAQHVKVPHVWLDVKGENLQDLKYGYATYKLSVKIAAPSKRLALKIPSIGTAFRLFVDEQLITQAGIVGTSKELAKAQYEPGIFSFDPPSDHFDIVVQVSNYDLIWGGIWNEIRLASPDTLHLEQSHENFKSTFIIAIFMTIAVFNLIQYSLRTVDPAPLVICITCLLLGLREIESAQVFAYMQVLYIPFELGVRVSFFTFFACLASIVAYYYFTFKHDYNKKVMVGIFAISAIYILITVVAPLSISSALVPSFQILALLVIFFISHGLIIAVKKKRPSANFILLGTLVLFSLIVHDILINLRLFDGVQLVSFGLVALIMCQNYATYSQFMIASDENTHLTEELSLRNNELKLFSKSLEDQVASRTAELSQVNAQLEVFAFYDSLTNALNRRGLLQRAEEAKKQFDTSKIPFCLLIIDFDYFKKLNDTHGHELGDNALAQGANSMRAVVESQGYIGRWGGEEFLILLNEHTIDGAKDVAEGIRVTIQELVSTKVGAAVSVSIGVSQYESGESIEKAINRADKALYEAKSAGRNCVVLANTNTSILSSTS